MSVFKKITSLSNLKKWESAQEGELRHHLADTWRPSENFEPVNNMLWRSFHFSPGDLVGGSILDVGAGPKLRSAFFRDARIYVIEPLAEKFVAEIEWCDLDRAEKVFSVPAEDYVDELEGSMDFVACVNTLDHTYDPARILSNCRRYLKKNGAMMLSVDLSWKADRLHPSKLNRRNVDAMLGEAGLAALRVYIGLPNKEGFGHGVAYSLFLVPHDRPGTVRPEVVAFLGAKARRMWKLLTALRLV